MPLVKTISDTAGMIGLWKITEPVDLLEKQAPEGTLQQPSYLGMKNDRRRKEWLATRILLKIIAGDEAVIHYSKEGKPELQHTRFKYISISHSGAFVCIYLHEKLPVGIDIECLSRNYNAIAGKYLADQEKTQVSEDPTLLCLYWCAKEAIFKLVKDNGIDFRKQIHIKPFHPEQSRTLIARFSVQDEEAYYELQFEAIEDHFMVWATDQPIDY